MLNLTGITVRLGGRTIIYDATASLPPVDLIVYTGRGQDLADALTFESAYAEFAFAHCLWPDFTAEDLQHALADFGHRERRFGKTSAQVQTASG